MTEIKNSEKARHPPDNAPIVIVVDGQVRITRLGLVVIVAGIVVMCIALLIWMSPAQASELLTILLTR